MEFIKKSIKAMGDKIQKIKRNKSDSENQLKTQWMTARLKTEKTKV